MRKFFESRKNLHEVESLLSPSQALERTSHGIVDWPLGLVSGEYEYSGTDAMSAEHRYRGKVSAVGFTGGAPVGAVLLVAPYNRFQELQAWIGQINSAYDTSSYGYGQGFALWMRTNTLPRDVVMLHPGDVHRFEQPLNDGIAPWLVVPGHYFWNVSDLVMPAVIRIWEHENQEFPTRLAYTPTAIANSVRIAINSNPVSGYGAAAGFHFTPAATHLTLHIVDDALTTASIVGSETATLEVYWKLQNGLWVHNGSDDWDAAGRGIASATHDAEVYAIPRGALAVTVVQSAGDSVGYVATFSDAGPYF